MRKRLISVLLTFVMTAASLPFTALTGAQAILAASVGERYTVLVLDQSDSMRGTPLEVMQEAAVDFCASLLAADSNHHIGIVTYDSSAGIANEFTTDLAELTETIDNITARNARNINDGLLKADILLSEAPEGAARNLVLMSKNTPNRGRLVLFGKYSFRDHATYLYANAVERTALKLMEEGYDLYAIGFLEDLSDSGSDFMRTLMYDVQNAGYYAVERTADLNDTFQSVAGQIATGMPVSPEDPDEPEEPGPDPNSETPIIVLPGVMGSDLYSDDTDFSNENKVWEPRFALSSLAIGRKLKNDELYVKPPEDQNTAEDREYGVTDTYEELIDRLCFEFPDREIYFFSYDWRKSMADSAGKLNEFIESLGSEQVDLVCHSFGGLIASKYYADNLSDNRINKIVTAGTPYEGSPETFNRVQTYSIPDGDIMSWVLSFLGMFDLVGKDVKTSFVSSSELVPTENYIDEIKMWQDEWEWLGNEDYELTYDEYMDYCVDLFNRQMMEEAEATHASLHAGGDFNALLDFPDAYFAVGVNQPTISAVKFQKYSNELNNILYENDIQYDMRGDGSVPYYSATISNQLSGIDANRYQTFATDHDGLIGHSPNKNSSVDRGADDSLDWIINTIAERPVAMMRAFRALPVGYIAVRVENAAEVRITKDGEYLSSNESDFVDTASFGRMDLLGETGEIQMFCLSDIGEYAIELTGSDTGAVNYKISRHDADGVLLAECVIDNITVTDTTKITTTSDFSQKATLFVDQNGDGTAEEIITETPSEPSAALPEDGQEQEEPIQEEPVKDEPVQDEPDQDELVQDEPVQDEPVQDEPVQDEPVQDEPVQDEPEQDEPDQEAVEDLPRGFSVNVQSADDRLSVAVGRNERTDGEKTVYAMLTVLNTNGVIAASELAELSFDGNGQQSATFTLDLLDYAGFDYTVSVLDENGAGLCTAAQGTL